MTHIVCVKFNLCRTFNLCKFRVLQNCWFSFLIFSICSLLFSSARTGCSNMDTKCEHCVGRCRIGGRFPWRRQSIEHYHRQWRDARHWNSWWNKRFAIATKSGHFNWTKWSDRLIIFTWTGRFAYTGSTVSWHISLKQNIDFDCNRFGFRKTSGFFCWRTLSLLIFYDWHNKVNWINTKHKQLIINQMNSADDWVIIDQFINWIQIFSTIFVKWK